MFQFVQFPARTKPRVPSLALQDGPWQCASVIPELEQKEQFKGSSGYTESWR